MGIFNPLYIAVSWVIMFFHGLLAPLFGTDSGVTWGFAIIGLVILIRILLIPLFVKQIKSQRALTVLQPELKEIQKKYKDDRQKQSEEMMKLYQKHGTNPLASCLPILAQAPIFFALFGVLNGIGQGIPRGVLTAADVSSAGAAKIFGAPISATFLGSNVTTVKVVSMIMIILMSASTFTTQRQLMVKGMPKNTGAPNMMVQQQKIMLYLFPVIFAISGVNFPIGVLLYWLTTNLWTTGQQFYVIKRNPTPGSPAYEELEAKRALKNGVKSTDEEAPGDVVIEEPKGQRQQPKNEKKKKKRGGQKGHPKHERKRVPIEQCDEVVALKPTECRGCGEALRGDDPDPLRHQVWELPQPQPIITEYQRHRLTCACCGKSTCAELPEGVPEHMSGPRLIAVTAV